MSEHSLTRQAMDVPRPSSPELKKMLENEESRLKQIT